MNIKRLKQIKDMAYLQPNYDSRASFYNKAEYFKNDNGDIVLHSYGTPVCRVNADGSVWFYRAWNYSATTLRHVKEFLYQFSDLNLGSKGEIEKYINEHDALIDK